MTPYWKLTLYILTYCDIMASVNDSKFYDNLTLGTPSILRQIPGIRDVRVSGRPPCEKISLSSWEQRYTSQLPADLRSFYQCTDGFNLTWSFKYGDEVLPVGRMAINPILQLQKISSFCSVSDSTPLDLPDLDFDSHPNKPKLGPRSRVFEMDSCEDLGKVCLAYPNSREGDSLGPSVWFLDRAFQWHFLAQDFSTYFRMMLVHLGLPEWQCRFTPMGLTPWAEQVFSLVAPHLLHENNHWQKGVPEAEVLNTLDSSIFKRKKGEKKEQSKGATQS